MTDPAAPTPPAPPAPAPAAQPVQPSLPLAPPAPPVDLAAERERWKAEAERAQALAREASEQASRAKSELHAALVDTHLTTLAARTIAPQHVVALLRSALEVDAQGRVVVKGKPDQTPAQYVEAWLAAEGRHFLPPSVPTGAGASPFPGAPPVAAPIDLRTSDGATRFVHGLLEPPAPVTPARSGSQN